jgi:DNA replication protein DnaC
VAEIAEKSRQIAANEAKRDAGSIAAVMLEFQQVAAKATGLTVEQLLAAEVATENVEKARIAREVVANRGVPEIHLRHVYDADPVNCDALNAVRTLVGGQSLFLVLTGGVGTRKSGSAAWALTQRSGLFISANELARCARSNDEESRATWRSLRRLDLAVIDDVGSEYDSDWFRSVFNDVVNTRYEACLKTIITCNLEPDVFKKRYGDRVLDRIRGTGIYQGIGGGSAR